MKQKIGLPIINALAIKKDFPIFKRKINGKPLVYLDSAATSQKPRCVIDAIVDYYEHHNANVARGVHTLTEESTQLFEKSRETVARFIHAKPEEIIFLRNATEALNLVAYSWGLSNLKKGDTIISTILEHHSSVLPWRMVMEKTGATIKYVDVDEEGVLLMKKQETRNKKQWEQTRDITELLDEHVKVVAFSAKSNMTGAIQPVDDIVALVRKKCPNAIIILDGSHSVPHMPTDVSKLGVDFLAFSGHKMLGPMGIGVLWGRKKLLHAMPPFLRGGDMISSVTRSGETWNDVPHKFEAGTPDVASAVGLAAAIEYLENVGMEEIHRHEVALTAWAYKLLTSLKLPKILMIGPRSAEARAGVVTFNIDGVHAHDVAQILDSEGVEVRSGHHCTGPLMERFGIAASVRASFYLYNTKEDVDKFIEALKKVSKVFKL